MNIDKTNKYVKLDNDDISGGIIPVILLYLKFLKIK